MFRHCLTTATLAAALCSPAMAITMTGSNAQGATVVTDFSATDLVSFDLDLAASAPVALNFSVDAGDLGMPIALNAVLRNFTGSGFDGYTFALSKGVFGTVGTVNRQFSGSTLVSAGGGFATLAFDSPEFLDVEIGNALGSTPGAVNWTLDGLAVGDSFTLTVSAVPEPGTTALLLAGLAAVGHLARRRS